MIRIPNSALVLLIGASGSGKSTFASRHFDAPTVISSDQLRGAFAGDEADQHATDAVVDAGQFKLEGSNGRLVIH